MNQSAAEQQIITFWLPGDEKAAIEGIAKREERTVSALLRLLVRERIAKEDA